MGMSLNLAMKSHKELENKMNNDEPLHNNTEEVKQKLPIFKANILQNENVIENNNQNMTVNKSPSKGKNKYVKLSFKNCDKSSEDLKVLSNQLKKFLKYVWTAQEFSYYLCDLPSQMQNNLDVDAKELESIYLQIKATSNNIETIKAQHKAIQKEKHAMNEVLFKKTEEEKHEKEMIVSIYDRVMHSRWEAVKTCQSETVVENFLVDVEGKLQAMKHLQTLVCEKLSKMKGQMTDTSKENNFNKKDNKDKRNNGKRGEANKQSTLKRFNRVDFLSDDHGWDPIITSEHPSTSSFFSSQTSSIDSFIESQSDDTINAALHVEMNSVLQALFGEQLPLRSSALTDPENDLNSNDVD